MTLAHQQEIWGDRGMFKDVMRGRGQRKAASRKADKL